jgi:hypothetical protein
MSEPTLNIGGYFVHGHGDGDNSECPICHPDYRAPAESPTETPPSATSCPTCHGPVTITRYPRSSHGIEGYEEWTVTEYRAAPTETPGLRAAGYVYRDIRNVIGFLRSCVRSGEQLNPTDEAYIDAALDAVRDLEAAALGESVSPEPGLRADECCGHQECCELAGSDKHHPCRVSA